MPVVPPVFALLISTLLLLLPSQTSAHATPCFPTCRFTFCPYSHHYTLSSAPDVSFTSAICDKRRKILVGHVDSTAEAYIRPANGIVIDISKYKPPGLLQNFSPSVLKSFSVRPDKHDRSGIGHETLQQNQAHFLKGACVAVPLAAYQIIDPKTGYVIDNKHPKRSLIDCVAIQFDHRDPVSPSGVKPQLPSPPHGPDGEGRKGEKGEGGPVEHTPYPTHKPCRNCRRHPKPTKKPSPPRHGRKCRRRPKKPRHPVIVPVEPNPTPGYARPPVAETPKTVPDPGVPEVPRVVPSPTAIPDPGFVPPKVPTDPRVAPSPTVANDPETVAPTPVAEPDPGSGTVSPTNPPIDGPLRPIPILPSDGPVKPPSKPKRDLRKLPMVTPFSGAMLKDPVKLGTPYKGKSYTFTKKLIVGTTSGVKEDLYLLTDATGSMNIAIETVQKRIGEIVADRVKMSKDAAFGVGYFKDEASVDNGFTNLQAITKDVKAINTAVSKLKAAGGGDYPEAGLHALYMIATSGAIHWREGARRIVAMFGDAPQHEPSCVGPRKHTRASVIEALKLKGITVVMIDVGEPRRNLDSKTLPYKCDGETGAGEGQATAIAKGTGGAILRNPKQEEVVAEIVKAVGTLELELSADTSDCDGKYEITFNPVLPATVKQGVRLMLKQTVKVVPWICTSRSGNFCKVRFTASGGDLATQIVGARVVRGC